LAASLEEKYKFLDRLAGTDISKIKLDLSRPILIDRVEWHMSVRELCGVISELKGDPSILINPGIAGSESWHEIGFKGGSETGVLNYTHILQKKTGGDFYSVSATINNESAEVQTEKFTEITARIISLIEDEKLEKSK
jgi:hypothetical protein